MFSLPGDTVLDPFLGTGTTAAAAMELGRQPVGYEISPVYVRMARAMLEKEGAVVEVQKRQRATASRQRATASTWEPRVPDMEQPAAVSRHAAAAPELHTVTGVADDCVLTLNSGRRVALGGISVLDAAAAAGYLRDRVLKRRVFLKDECPAPGGCVEARVLLKNRICVNAYLVRAGMARKNTAR